MTQTARVTILRTTNNRISQTKISGFHCSYMVSKFSEFEEYLAKWKNSYF
jgi:hypothetical protein